MKLKQRLAYLGGPPKPPRPTVDPALAPTSPSAELGASLKSGAPLVASTLQSEACSPRGDQLAELRSRMAAILGRSQTEPAAAPRHDVALTTLPFVDVETPEGRLCQRLEAQRPSARVGRMQLHAAAGADAGLLSLLALQPELADCDLRGALYFDTETTGLGGAGTVAFLLGMAWFDDEGQLQMEQLLLRQPAEELGFLRRFEALVARSSLLVSYNGKSFDWPLLQGRRVMNRLPELAAPPHLDLLHLCRRIHKRRLSRVRLLDLESEVLGWERGEDDIPGAEIAPRYGHFLRTGDEAALRAVVDHNAWDVLSMVALVGLYGERLADEEGASLEHADDWLGLAQTFGRARSFERAETATLRAIESGVGPDGLRLSAKLHQARGDKARALEQLRHLHEQVRDEGTRLALCKLLEHYQKDFDAALTLVEQGTGESEPAWTRRRERLERKARKRRDG